MNWSSPKPLSSIRSALVTGGAGFVGSRLARALLKRHPACIVYICDLHVPEPSGGDVNHLRQQIPGVKKYYVCDLGNYDATVAILKETQPQVVFHAAGIIPKRKYWKNLEIYQRGNFSISQTLLRAISFLRSSGELPSLKALVYTSSADAIKPTFSGNQSGWDEARPYPPPGGYKDDYSESKAQSEQAVLAANDPASDFVTAALRPHCIFGEGDSHILHMLWHQHVDGKGGMQIGDGRNLMDFIYVDNNSMFHLLCAEHLLGPAEARERTAGQAFHISNGQPELFWNLTHSIESYFALDPYPTEMPKERPELEPKKVVSVPLAKFIAMLMEFFATLFRMDEPPLSSKNIQEIVFDRWFSIKKAERAFGWDVVKQGVNMDRALWCSIKWFLEYDVPALAAEKESKKTR